jgi:hypothetical protein
MALDAQSATIERCSLRKRSSCTPSVSSAARHLLRCLTVLIFSDEAGLPTKHAFLRPINLRFSGDLASDWATMRHAM